MYKIEHYQRIKKGVNPFANQARDFRFLPLCSLLADDQASTLDKSIYNFNTKYFTQKVWTILQKKMLEARKKVHAYCGSYNCALVTITKFSNLCLPIW